jgi:hypothetical protein
MTMDESPHAVVLDEMDSPEGVVQLTAFERDGVVWIGVRGRSPDLSGAMGLHTGSEDHLVDGTAIMTGTWALAWGAVAPEIERARVRSEGGELFPAKIVSLPPEYNDPYRAVWGIAEPCMSACAIIGFDRTGIPIEPGVIRPRKRGPLTAEARLERIRQMADRALRYHATAYLKASDEEEKKLHMTHMSLSSDVMALAEQGATDTRSMLSWRSSIITRYLDIVKTDPWTPSYTGPTSI